MAQPDAVFIFIGTYPNETGARADYDVVKALHLAGAVGTYDAAVVTKDAAGKVHVNKDEMSTRHGAWGGAAVGALVGILFPPSIIASAAVGAAVGGGTGVFAAALASLGIPKDSVIRYQADLKSNKFLLIASGDAAQVEQARATLAERGGTTAVHSR